MIATAWYALTWTDVLSTTCHVTWCRMLGKIRACMNLCPGLLGASSGS